MTRSIFRTFVLLALTSSALVVAPSALSATAEPASAPASGDSCAGPCPIVIFGLGNAAGRINVVTKFNDGRPDELALCDVAPGTPCDLQIDEYSMGALLKPTSTGFRGWYSCPQPNGNECFVPVNSASAACAAFTRTMNDPIPSTNCPPPFVQFYKKGDGRGTVTATGGAANETCASLCPSAVWTQFPGGSPVTLTATPSEGSFVRWEGAMCAGATGNTCTFTLTNTATVCAVFQRTPGSPLDANCPASPGTNPQPRDLAPKTRITAGPSATRATRSRRATFRFASSESGSRFQCRLDTRPWTSCRSPRTYTRLRLGVHTFRVKAIDAGGKVDTTPAVRRWRIRA